MVLVARQHNQNTDRVQDVRETVTEIMVQVTLRHGYTEIMVQVMTKVTTLYVDMENKREHSGRKK